MNNNVRMTLFVQLTPNGRLHISLARPIACEGERLVVINIASPILVMPPHDALTQDQFRDWLCQLPEGSVVEVRAGQMDALNQTLPPIASNDDKKEPVTGKEKPQEGLDAVQVITIGAVATTVAWGIVRLALAVILRR